MAFARNNGQMPQKGTLAYYEKQSAAARSSLFTVIVLTLVNIVLTLVAKADGMFLFSALIPWTFAVLAKETYDALGIMMYLPLIISVVYMVGSLVCALLWKKGLAASIIAAILYFVDCLFLALAMVGAGAEAIGDSIATALFHALIMVYLIVGIVNEAKAIKLRKEAEAAVPFAAQEQAAVQQGPEL